mmetsp:Transcript_113015/g.314524  ORF Transcript_113015/g.314524 Transcript_113015/m.314524 type:complete len:235 (+) Transcript_113015:391-1095(+)
MRLCCGLRLAVQPQQVVQRVRTDVAWQAGALVKVCKAACEEPVQVPLGGLIGGKAAVAHHASHKLGKVLTTSECTLIAVLLVGGHAGRKALLRVHPQELFRLQGRRHQRPGNGPDASVQVHGPHASATSRCSHQVGQGVLWRQQPNLRWPQQANQQGQSAPLHVRWHRRAGWLVRGCTIHATVYVGVAHAPQPVHKLDSRAPGQHQHSVHGIAVECVGRPWHHRTIEEVELHIR